MAVPSPEAGLVLSYAYLWRDEAAAGYVEATESHPAVIVLVQEQGLKPLVTVVPITHSKPRQKDIAVELPPKVAVHLGLDNETHWVIVNESNQFTWPGFDIRKARHGAEYYGHVPPKLLEQIASAFVKCAEAGAKSTPRDEAQPVTSARPSRIPRPQLENSKNLRFYPWGNNWHPCSTDGDVGVRPRR